MLLSVEDIEQITGSGDLEIRDNYDELWASFEVSPGPCASVPFNVVVQAYRDSGYEAVSGMNMWSSQVTWEYWVDEGVVRFPTDHDARRFVTDAEVIWRKCEGDEVRAVPEEGGAVQWWTVGSTTQIPDVRALVVTSTLADTPGYVCSHAMTDRANLVIDVVVCTTGVTDEAVTIMDRIANRPPI
jgi:eukaryotic-like serine/threonine-protein kinase